MPKVWTAPRRGSLALVHTTRRGEEPRLQVSKMPKTTTDERGRAPEGDAPQDQAKAEKAEEERTILSLNSRDRIYYRGREDLIGGGDGREEGY
ncbi:MAG TPA: hypothetical protein ENF41_02990 [Candidatus Bathyarchaeota archaeon]|nr:hypothetical protein [Candidatus Bathyarchaeota archaeon]